MSANLAQDIFAGLPIEDESSIDDASTTAFHNQYPKNPEQWDSQLWRLHNIYYIVSKEGYKIKFQPNWAQIALLEDLWYLNLILKARQLGFTTFIDLILLDNCVWADNKRAGIIAHNREDAKVIFRDKVKYPFDNLPEQIRTKMTPKQDSLNELLFPNNSSIRVGTSLRSGTLNYLHISEYGKLCAKTPEKAREVKTGALNTVQSGQIIFIESTAEGRQGHYFDMCQSSQKDEQAGKKLTKLDYKFHFFPWWKHPEYVLEVDDKFVIPKENIEYFQELEAKLDIKITREQRAWYLKKAESQGEDMKREFPSTPEEAFEASVEGAYYKKEMAKMRLEKRIRKVPLQDNFPVNTFWDLGFNDETFIICHQHIGLEHRFVNCFTDSGEQLSYYVKWLQKQGYTWGKHYLPHDGGHTKLQTGKTDEDRLNDLGMRPTVIVPRVPDDLDGVKEVRAILGSCWIDEENCQPLIDALDGYRKEWNDKLGTWNDHPLHDASSHGAKAFEGFARGYNLAPRSGKKRTRRPRSPMAL